MRMRPEIRARWVEALRSGEYDQTQGVLNDGSGFCCLGVLCELAVAEGVVERGPAEELGSGSFRHTYGHRYGGDGLVLPSAVIEWAGIVDPNGASTPRVGVVREDGGGYEYTARHPLAELNDEHNWNFERIADAIENDTYDPEPGTLPELPE